MGRSSARTTTSAIDMLAGAAGDPRSASVDIGPRECDENIRFRITYVADIDETDAAVRMRREMESVFAVESPKAAE